jgi:ectoine hydroxylase-related dioxygenase (phytanoyl-CoA dioxygenase family)
MRHEPEKWQADYDRDGYLVVEDAIDPKTLAALRAGIEKITSNPDALPPRLHRHLDFEKNFVARRPGINDLTPEQVGNAIRNVMELPLFDQIFADLVVYSSILDVLEALFRSPEYAFHNYKCIIKAPKVSSKFVWHRDLPYLEHSTPNLITSMICLDEMTEQNGATVVLPGTHRIPHEEVKATDTDIPESELPKDAKHVTVLCPAGSLVLFHVNIIHGGGANRSDAPRRNVISIWSGPDTYPVTPARYAFQDLMPRSKDPARQRQTRMTFPHLFQK